jgi:glycosyltransferase involved in cell wall biosynthesis
MAVEPAHYTQSLARLLFFTGTTATVQRGSGTYVGISVLRNALIALGHEVELIAPPAPLGSALARLWFNYCARKQARNAQHDAIVGFDLDGIFVSPHGALDVASIKGVLAEELRFEKGWARVSLLIQSRFERLRVRSAGRILTTSHYAARSLEKHYGIPARDVRIVPELIDLERWRTALDDARPLSRPEPSILCVAHLYPRKDVGTLLDAMARLQLPAMLRVVGVGPELPRLRRLARTLAIERRVEFLEHVSFSELAQEYRNADVFCLPSRQEGFGIVLLEAMAAGLPVVAARASAIPEVVPDGECGLLVEPGDSAGFAAAIERFLSDPLARAQFGNAGQRHAARYDAPLVAAEFLAALDLGGINRQRGM